MSVLEKMFLVLETADWDEDAGTDSPITLVCNVAGVDRIYHTVTDTPQADLDKGQANLYEIPVPSGLVKDDLREGSFRLEIRGPDWWRPERVFVIAIDKQGKNHVLVSIPDWVQGGLSTDTSEGKTSYPLPLAE